MTLANYEYATPDIILEGLHERFLTISEIKACLDHEPAAVQVTPMIYSLVKRYRKQERGNIATETFEFTHRLIVDSSEVTTAEPRLRSLMLEVPISVERDPQLDNRISRGMSFIEEGIAGYVRIQGTTYRILDFTSRTTSSRPQLRP